VDRSDLYYLFIRAFAASILAHDALYVCRDGKDYVLSCFLPVFGLRLSPQLKATVHALLAACCLALILTPGSPWLYPICLALLTVKIASYSLRLANHMIFAWFVSALMTVAWMKSLASPGGAVTADTIDFVLTGAAGLVLQLYLFAFFHKLNREYLNYQTSCATAFVDFFCWDRRISNPRLIRFYRHFAVHGTLALEAAIPVLLFFGATRSLGVLIAVVFHYILGLMGIINFSMFMYAGLIAFVPAAALASGVAFMTGDAQGWFAVCALSAIFISISWKWTPRRAAQHCPYRHRAAAWVIQTAFAILTAVLLVVCLNWLAHEGGTLTPHQLSNTDTAILGVILLAFFFNGITPYLGNKTEFSFAMFSNLRIEPWTHLLIPESWRAFRTPQYVEVHAIEGLPHHNEIAGKRPAELCLHVLSQPDKYFYSRYFFREALRELRMAVRPHPTIRVRYTELGRLREAQLSDLESLGPCLRVTRFPFVMPKDHQARHSEQGALPGNSERQLF
jgi:hypothetical protein